MSKSAEATNLKYPPIDSVEAMNNELGEPVPSEAAGMTISVVESRGDRQTAAVPKPSEVFGNKTQASESARAAMPVNLPNYPGPDPRSRRAHSEAGASPHTGEIMTASDGFDSSNIRVSSGTSKGLGRRATSEPARIAPVSKTGVPQAAPKPARVSKFATGELVAVTASNHSRRVYRIDENGKKRAISQDAVMEIYGTADKKQGKRPRVAATEKVADDLTEKESTDTTPEQTKLVRRLAQAKLVGKATLRLINRVAMAGEKLDMRVGKWAVQKTNGTKLQDKLAQVKEQGTQKGKDIAATATTQLEKAKQKRSALWVRIHERRTELSKSTHNFGEKTTDVFNRHRFTAGVLAGILLVGGAVMATSGSDSNEHAKDRVIAGSTPQHDANKLGGSIFGPPNLFTPAAPETANEHKSKINEDLGPGSVPKVAKVPAPAKEAAPAHKAIAVHKGDRLWNALERVIPEGQIMKSLDDAAKASGLSYEWHGSGTHKWIEVDGHSDTKTVMNDLGKFIQR